MNLSRLNDISLFGKRLHKCPECRQLRENTLFNAPDAAWCDRCDERLKAVALRLFPDPEQRQAYRDALAFGLPENDAEELASSFSRQGGRLVAVPE